MAPTRRRVSYIIPPPTDPVPRLQLPPHGIPRKGVVGPIIIPSSFSNPETDNTNPNVAQHPRHRLGIASLALDTATQLVGRSSPEGILYSGGRDGQVISWDLGIPIKRRSHRYGVTGQSLRRWEVMTNWADDIIEEEVEESEELRSDGDVLGEVTRTKRRAVAAENDIPFEEQWETDLDALESNKASPPRTQFRQSAQMHSDWVNDILLCNHNQTLVSASSDGTVRAWSPHAHEGMSESSQEPTTLGTHADYVRCLTHCRDQGWVASGSFDRTIKLWDLASSNGEPLITLQAPESSGPKASVYAIATDPYGSVIASGSPEKVVRMWDPRSGKRVGKLVGHTDNIRAILISEDAKYLLTGSADASIKLWSLSSQRCLHTFTYHTDSVWSLFSSHPALEIFYSGDRSGLVCKVDMEGCADISDGECIVLCQDNGSGESGYTGAEGINKMVAMDDNLLWTASGSSSLKRWKVPPRRADRATVLSGAEGVPQIESPLEWRPSSPGKFSLYEHLGHRTRSPPRSPSRHDHSPIGLSRRESLASSLGPSDLSVTQEQDAPPEGETEGEDTWYGIPFESLVRLVSPNESFTGFGMFRGRDVEIATLYSAASIKSIPRIIKSPIQSSSAFQHSMQSPSVTIGRSTSPFRSETLHSLPRRGEETQTLHVGPRAAFEEREVAADAVPLRDSPDEVIEGERGLVRCATLNDRVHVLTVDTAGEVAVWNIVRGVCLGRFLSEDIAAASLYGSEASASIRGMSADEGSATEKERAKEKERSPREALETVRERIEGEAVVAPWSTIDTKTGVLTVHLNEKCFEAELYADEAGYPPEQRFSDDMRLNIGKWVLRNLFHNFIREELRVRRDSFQHRLHRGSAPTHIDLNGHSHISVDPRQRSSSDASLSSSVTGLNLRSPTVVTSPNMLPAVSPMITATRSSPLMTPLIPLGASNHDSGLSPIPQSPANDDATPMPPRAVDVPGAVSSPLPHRDDYFSLRARRGSVSANGSNHNPTTPDDFSSWGGKTPSIEMPMPQTPSTPSGGLMGRIRAFGKSTKRHTDVGGVTSPTSSGSENTETHKDVVAPILPKTPAQILLSGNINPAFTSEAPPLPISPHTALLISEEALSGWTTLYRGHVSSTGGDMHALEETMPMWLLEYLLMNKIPPVPVNKLSFVLLPYPNKDPDGEQLPELLNTAQSKLTASRFLRARKLTHHVHEKLEKMSHSRPPGPPIHNTPTPRSSTDTRSLSSHTSSKHREGDSTKPRPEDLYEILCNDVVLPLDMTLAAVRQYIWRQSGELTMHYRRKTDAHASGHT